MGAADVIAGNARWSCEAADALEWLRALPTDAVDVLFTSPPYTDARTYGVGAARKSAVWVEWMREIVREACRVAGVVFLNVSDQVKAGCYQNGPEWLHADLTRLDGMEAIRPYIWFKSGPGEGDPGNGTPGSGHDHYHRNDYEPIYGYARPGGLPPKWTDNLAFGHPPKYAAGGKTRCRDRAGARKVRTVEYVPPAVSNPGNIIRAMVGGGRIGHPVAHHGEAPMPVMLAERFVCWFCPPDGIVADCFSGSGTTCHASVMHGRRFIGADLRQSQVDLCARRMKSVTPNLIPA